jgi:tetratricopeptide (TPR) repeat protein
MSKKWSQSEISYLKRFAASKRLDELAQRFEADPAQVRAKLLELGLGTKEGAATEVRPDPLVADFEGGIKALYASDWAAAEELLGRVAAESDLLDLGGRARQYLAICRARRAETETAAEDPYLLAVFRKNRGEYAAALKLCDGKARSDDERFLYLAASIHALEGRTAEAVRALTRAIELNPKNRVHAFHDPDFAKLREEREHARLFGLD